MKAVMAGAVFLGLAAAIAGCGGSDSKTTTTPAASAAAPTKAAATTPSATKASASPAATSASASPAAAAGGSGTCKYLGDADAGTLIPKAIEPKVSIDMDTERVTATSCLWRNDSETDRVFLIGTEEKTDAALALAKKDIDNGVKEKIDGLGDNGGFAEKTSERVRVIFIKGKTQIFLTVATPGVKADAVAAVAKKIAAGL